MKNRMTDDLKPFTRNDLNIYMVEHHRKIEQQRRDATVRRTYNSVIEKIKSVPDDRCYEVYAHIDDMAFISGEIENRLRNLFPDFVVTTEVTRCNDGLERQRITVKW